MALPLIGTASPRAQYTGNGSQTAFAVPFEFLANTDIEVYVDGVLKTLNTDYTLTGASVTGGGTCTFTTAPALDAVVTILGALAYSRALTRYNKFGALPANSLETDFARLQLQVKQIQRDVSFASRIPPTEALSGAQMQWPSKTARAGRYAYWNPEGALEPAVQLTAGTTLSASVIGTFLYPRTTAEVAAGVTPSNYAYEPGDVRRYGAVGDGVADDTVAIQNACNCARFVYLPAGTYKTTSVITIADGSPVVVRGDSYLTIIDKQFNGDVISLGKRSELRDLTIQGNGGTRTGRGVIITTGSLDETSWRKLFNVSILGTASYAIEFTAATAGYASQVEMCRLVPFVQTTHAIKLPSGETNNGNRVFINVWSFGARLIDFGECDNTLMIGCQGAVPTHTSNSKKVTMVGCRIVNSGDGSVTTWAVNGQQSSFTGNIIATTAVTLASTCASVKWQGNSVSGVTVTDSTTGTSNGNEIDLGQQTYTPTWTSTGTGPAIGNGTLNGAYRRSGELVHVNIRFEPGSTSTFGTGFYRFSLPYTASRRSVGSAYVEDVSGVAVYVGTAMIDSGTNTVYVTTSGSTSAYMGAASPFTWASGDKCWIDIDYAIQ